MKQLIIRPTANGYIDEPLEPASNCVTSDTELHVFTTPTDLASHIFNRAKAHEETRDAAADLKAALSE